MLVDTVETTAADSNGLAEDLSSTLPLSGDKAHPSPEMAQEVLTYIRTNVFRDKCPSKSDEGLVAEAIRRLYTASRSAADEGIGHELQTLADDLETAWTAATNPRAFIPGPLSISWQRLVFSSVMGRADQRKSILSETLVNPPEERPITPGANDGKGIRAKIDCLPETEVPSFFLSSYWDLLPNGCLCRADTDFAKIGIDVGPFDEPLVEGELRLTKVIATDRAVDLEVPPGYMVRKADADISLEKSSLDTYRALLPEHASESKTITFSLIRCDEGRFAARKAWGEAYEPDVTSPESEAADVIAGRCKTSAEKVATVLKGLEQQDLVYSTDKFFVVLEGTQRERAYSAREAIPDGNCSRLSVHVVNRIRKQGIPALYAGGYLIEEGDKAVRLEGGHARPVFFDEAGARQVIEATSLCSAQYTFDTSELGEERLRELVASLAELPPSEYFERLTQIRAQYRRYKESSERRTQPPGYGDNTTFDSSALSDAFARSFSSGFGGFGGGSWSGSFVRERGYAKVSAEAAENSLFKTTAFSRSLERLSDAVTPNELLSAIYTYSHLSETARELADDFENDQMNEANGTIPVEKAVFIPEDWEEKRWLLIRAIRRLLDRLEPGAEARQEFLLAVWEHLGRRDDYHHQYPALLKSDYIYIFSAAEVSELSELGDITDAFGDATACYFERRVPPNLWPVGLDILEHSSRLVCEWIHAQANESYINSHFFSYALRHAVTALVAARRVPSADQERFLGTLREVFTAFDAGKDQLTGYDIPLSSTHLMSEFIHDINYGYYGHRGSLVLEGCKLLGRHGVVPHLIDAEGRGSKELYEDYRRHFFMNIHSGFSRPAPEVLSLFNATLADFFDPENESVKKHATHEISNMKYRVKKLTRINVPWDEQGRVIPGREVSALIALSQHDRETAWMPDEIILFGTLRHICEQGASYKLMSLIESLWTTGDQSVSTYKYISEDLDLVTDDRGVFIQIHDIDAPQGFFIPLQCPKRLLNKLNIAGIDDGPPKPQIAELWEHLDEHNIGDARSILDTAVDRFQFQFEAEYYRRYFEKSVSPSDRFHAAIAVLNFFTDESVEDADKIRKLQSYLDEASRATGKYETRGRFNLSSAASTHLSYSSEALELARCMESLSPESYAFFLKMMRHASGKWGMNPESKFSDVFGIYFAQWTEILRTRELRDVPMGTYNSAMARRLLRVLLSEGRGNQGSVSETHIEKVATDIQNEPIRRIGKGRANTSIASRYGLRVLIPQVSRSASGDRGDHKSYTYGDDTREIDWNAYARTEQLYVYQRLEEFQEPVHYLVDLSWLKNGDAPWEVPQHVCNLLKCMAHIPGDFYLFFRGEQIMHLSEDAIAKLFRKGSKEAVRFIRDLCNLKTGLEALEQSEAWAGVRVEPGRLFRDPPRIAKKNTAIILCTPIESASRNETLIRSFCKGNVKRIELVLR